MTTETQTVADAVLAIGSQMSDDDIRLMADEACAESWRDGVSAMLVGEWAHLDLGDVLGALYTTLVVHCECGEQESDVYGTGEACWWSGPRSATVLVASMPGHYRSSHEAAGNRGSYPDNGGTVYRMERECAERAVKYDPDWTEIVTPTEES